MVEPTHPSIIHSLLPTLSTFSNTDNDFQSIVTSVQGLTVSLGTVTDHGEGVVFEVAVDRKGRKEWDGFMLVRGKMR